MARHEPDDPEELTQEEVEREAEASEHDPVTAREALETELIEKDESERGEDIGEHIE